MAVRITNCCRTPTSGNLAIILAIFAAIFWRRFSAIFLLFSCYSVAISQLSPCHRFSSSQCGIPAWHYRVVVPSLFLLFCVERIGVFWYSFLVECLSMILLCLPRLINEGTEREQRGNREEAMKRKTRSAHSIHNQRDQWDQWNQWNQWNQWKSKEEQWKTKATVNITIWTTYLLIVCCSSQTYYVRSKIALHTEGKQRRLSL